ncbi:hypothetical protein SAMD00019534_032530 [Acytostelium subglobosum LB1]|uniref:hypothetical protein n=1 Tax=Acytostelium subglobosum LB1 TaxID=1410327 RepID=UPI000644BDF2|nr:hypothetical protein SAMD00019534_032530 [Acytostelium subglobosum LB1]GAM20078.1 hypothetical protein SAMD00019534_032530 [Acytostelium subglobosum LB1]|eukprot:XP_012756840.1 hypothetical protein SAMD00019534_032530 [Acytostelium subglobosum LB1]
MNTRMAQQQIHNRDDHHHGPIMKVLTNRMLFRTIIKVTLPKETYRRFIAHILNRDNKVIVGLSTKYDQWVDAQHIINNKHYGLLRDRIKRRLHINFSFDAVMELCRSNDIDHDTFLAVYNRYQSYFSQRAAYIEAIKHDNLVVVKTLLHQREPVAFDRDFGVLSNATLAPNFTVLKYLLDSGLFNNNELWDNINHSWDSVFKTSSSSIRFLLDPHNNFPQPLVDAIKKHATSCVKSVMATGDLQLVNELLFKDDGTVKLFDDPITTYMIIPGITPAEQLAHFKRMLPPHEWIEEVAREKMAKYAYPDSTHDFMTERDMDPSRYIKDDFDVEQMMVFLKLGELEIDWASDPNAIELTHYMVYEYIKTGDCKLIPYFITGPSWYTLRNFKVDVSRLYSMILQHGNLAQAMMATSFFDTLQRTNVVQTLGQIRSRFMVPLWMPFLKADDMTHSFEIIKYFNSRNIVSTSNNVDQTINVFRGTTQMLDFFLSNDNKMFLKHVVMDSLILGLDHIDQLVKSIHSFNGISVSDVVPMLQLASIYGRMDLVSVITNVINTPTNNDMIKNELIPSIVAIAPLEVVKWMAQQRLIDAKMVAQQIGERGDCEMFECVLEHETSENSESIVCSILKHAITKHQVKLVKHIYGHKLKVNGSQYMDAVTCGNIEMLELLWSLDHPISDVNQLKQMVQESANNGHHETITWLFNRMS